MVAGFAIDACF